MNKYFISLTCLIILLITLFQKVGIVNSATKPERSPNLTIANVISQANPVDLKRLPLGDGKISNSPKVGWIWACRIDPNAGGAFRDGNWIKSDGTYDFTAKPIVQGKVNWDYRFKMSRQGNKRIFSTNDLPNHPTGIYPIAPNSEAFLYDRNPNRIAPQNMQVELPANPQLASQPSCASGAVGILLTGTVLFNALDALGRDAVAHETQDVCQGHPQEAGVYHYHSATTCLPDQTTKDGHSTLMGYSLDGFGIFGRHGESGKVLKSADLDVCHGHTHQINWDGKQISMYHYHATWDFPYTVGCMRGSYKMSDVMTISGPRPRRREGFPPQDFGNAPPRRPNLAIAAQKLGISEQKLRDALGAPPPNLEISAERLGISEQTLRDALGVP
ncbi:YHYH protein [Pseudanabaena yagii]|uniref:YHYH protein n=1 Tax=Pseudanabaena yagii GIHE-NHR1 TaxID=2722753 RepID=A0ABX1LW88_9CYAN|nr:YHYH protein [Pseudanabaena yagii]NMF60453.1 YHYH protein [Pseudanabaena yagii GIHE-NHR1]